MKPIFVVVLVAAALAPIDADAFTRSCWVLTDMSGQAMYAPDGFKPVRDGFTHSNPHITLVFDGLRTAASGDNVQLSQVGNYMAVGVVDAAGASVIETYSVDPSTQRAFYTKSSFMRGPLFDSLTATRAFVGLATPCR